MVLLVKPFLGSGGHQTVALYWEDIRATVTLCTSRVVGDMFEFNEDTLLIGREAISGRAGVILHGTYLAQLSSTNTLEGSWYGPGSNLEGGRFILARTNDESGAGVSPIEGSPTSS